MSAPKLLPCPFCGGVLAPVGSGTSVPKLEALNEEQRFTWRILCYNCFAQMMGNSREKLIAAWNRRAEAPSVTATTTGQQFPTAGQSETKTGGKR